MKSILFLIFLSLLINCSGKKTDKELFNEGNKNIKENKFPEAVMLFEELIKEYPNSMLADSTLLSLATIYQQKSIKNISAKESLEKSAQLFRRIYDEFPESKLAPMGLFMSGYVYANELRNYDKAREAYNLFIEKYPDNEMTVSARQEVEYMGLTPEEILEKNLAKEKSGEKLN